jgi:crotonobetainyl-CoA:carnitine CoA-transferase CaiB-like acyl-CoA transferase
MPPAAVLITGKGPRENFQIQKGRDPDRAVGAEVSKAEVPAVGDLSRKLDAAQTAGERQMGTSHLAFNANGKSIALNLRSGRGKEVFRRLASAAGVVLENFRPGAMEVAEMCAAGVV